MVDWTDGNQWSSSKKGIVVSESVPLVEFKPNKWGSYRMVGPAFALPMHWFTVQKKDGKLATFPKLCLGVDPTGKSEKPDSSKCPYCQHIEVPNVEFYQNVIDRAEQERQPNKLGRMLNSEKKPQVFMGAKAFYAEGLATTTAWTPMRMLRITRTIGKDITDITSLNRRRGEDGVRTVFPPHHASMGFDIQIKHKPDEKKAADKFSVQKGDNSELSSEEKRYLRWRIVIKPEDMETKEEAEREVKNIKPRLVDRSGKPIFPEEFDPSGKGKGGNSTKKSKSNRYKDEDMSDEDEDEDLEDEEEEDDRRSRSNKSKKGSSSKRSSKYDDEDDEDDDVDEDEDEDDYVPSRSKKKKTRSSRDDDDEDEDDEDDRPRSRVKTAAKKSKRRDDDDEDDDRPRKKKSRARYEDEDDDEIPF